MKITLDDALKIADRHAEKIRLCMGKLAEIFPLTTSNFENLSEEKGAFLETLCWRFTKLQDYMGAQIFPLILAANKERVEELTFIDRLNKLEKLRVIPNAKEWENIRNLRNNLTHEYPDESEVKVRQLNDIFKIIPDLLQILDQVKDFVKRKNLSQSIG